LNFSFGKLLEKRTLQGKVGCYDLREPARKISFGERTNPPQNRFRKRRKVQALTKGTSHAPGLVD